MLVSVILPTYNESGNILLLIEAIHAELGGVSHELILVDDDSPDGTHDLVAKQALGYVRCIRRKSNRGLAYSIQEGIAVSRGDIVVTMDTDFNHQPKYLPFMINSLTYYDCVVASRFQYGGGMDGWLRHKASWVFNIFTRVMTRGYITDSLYGYWAIRRSVLSSIPPETVFWGYGDYCIRLMYFLQKRDASVLQFPAVNGRRLTGESGTRFAKVLIQYTREVLKLSWKEWFSHGSSSVGMQNLQKSKPH